MYSKPSVGRGSRKASVVHITASIITKNAQKVSGIVLLDRWDLPSYESAVFSDLRQNPFMSMLFYKVANEISWPQSCEKTSAPHIIASEITMRG